MSLILRPGKLRDASIYGEICYEAFTTVAEQHGFQANYQSPQAATAQMVRRLTHPQFYSVVAELDGQVVGSNFLDERSMVAGLGPVTVALDVQNKSIGRQLMCHVMERAEAKHFRGVRLLLAAYHTRALCLYSKFGFQVRGMAAILSGEPIGRDLLGYMVRPATIDDVNACNQLCMQVHGLMRSCELEDGIKCRTASIVEHQGELTGYSSLLGVEGHAVGRTTESIKALIAAAPDFDRGAFLVPLNNTELLNWCLEQGLKVAVPQVMMSTGFHQEPDGAFLPSILF